MYGYYPFGCHYYYGYYYHYPDGGVKYATGASSKILGRDNITIGTWNTRAAGKLQALTHEMGRYR